MSATRRSALTRRRSGSSGHTKLLGAVKLSQSPLAGAYSDAGSPCSTASDASALATPQDRSPLVASRSGSGGTAGLAPPAATDGLAQFSQHLAASRSSDRWLEERLAPGGGRGGPSGPGLQRQQSAAPPPPSQQAVEPAASQIVSKALRFITGDVTPPAQKAPAPTAASFDSQSFLDKGMDAISGVGRLMEGFALTLDQVIGQAFEDWGGVQPPGASGSGHMAAPQRRPAAAINSSSVLTSAAAQPALRSAAARPAADWDNEFGASPGKENVGASAAATSAKPAATSTKPAAASSGRPGCPSTSGPSSSGSSATSRQPHITSFMSKLDAASEQEVAEWRKRAQQLAGELQRMRAQHEEYQRLRLQYDKLQSELQQASSAASRLAEENSALRQRGPADLVEADPLAAAQVAAQMEALLTEKSKLVAENDRLLRENTGLQELLEFTLVHQAQLAGDDELFGGDPYGEEEAAAGMAAAPEAAVPGAEGCSEVASA